MTAEQKYYLRPQSGGDDVELTAGMIVGRKEDCDLVVSDGHPSRKHAQIAIDETGVTVEDLGSANGTFVNGTRLESAQRLSPGDEVAFDASKFVFVVPGQEPEQPADATVVRSVEDLEKTILRSAEDLEKELAAAGAGAAEAGTVRPGSWADPQNKANPAGTQVFSKDELAQMVGEFSDTSGAAADPYLEIGSGPLAGSIIQLNAGSGMTEWSIGSDADRDVIVTGDGVSGFHAKIIHESGRWKLVDQMSANGTYINNQKALTAFLNSNDRIKFGTVECAIVLPGGAPAASGGAQPGSGTKPKKSGAMIGVVTFVAVLALLAVGYYLLS